LLEAIVGEVTITALEPSGEVSEAAEVLVMDGMAPIDELKSRLGLPNLPAEGSYHTLGGLLLAPLRRLPQVGDRVVFAGWRFEAVEMDDRRVGKVRISREAGTKR
jgi:putative hemolysin